MKKLIFLILVLFSITPTNAQNTYPQKGDVTITQTSDLSHAAYDVKNRKDIIVSRVESTDDDSGQLWFKDKDGNVKVAIRSTNRYPSYMFGELILGESTIDSKGKQLYVKGDSEFTGNVSIGTLNPNPYADLEVFNFNGTSHLRLHTNQHSGIAKLEIAGGSAYADDNPNNYSGWSIYHSHKQTNKDLYFRHGESGDPSVVFTDDGNLGIGISNPSRKLEVNGDIVLANNTGRKQIYTWHGGDENWRIGMNASPGFTRSLANSHVQYLTYANGLGQGFAIGVNGGESSFEVQGSDHKAFFRGNVGIGTSQPEYKLDVNGNARVKNALLVDGSDFILGKNDGRSVGSAPHQRALVHYNNDELFINFSGDFEGGTRVSGSKLAVDGKLVIGNVPIIGDYGVYVEKGILAEKVRVALKSSDRWADDAFGKKPSLEKMEKHIKRKSHLIGVPSAKELVKKGIDVAEMDATLLRQIEWLWEYTIESEKEKQALKEEVNQLNKRLKKLE